MYMWCMGGVAVERVLSKLLIVQQYTWLHEMSKP